MATDLDERTYTDEKLDVTDNGDHDMFAHYAKKSALTDAMVFGQPVVALCGKKWIPGRNPEKYSVCPECKEIYEGLSE